MRSGTTNTAMELKMDHMIAQYSVIDNPDLHPSFPSHPLSGFHLRGGGQGDATAPLGTFHPPTLEVVRLKFIIDVDKCKSSESMLM